MHRERFSKREGWEQKLRDIGFGFFDLPSADGSPYWQEGAGYVLSSAEVDQLEGATEELHGLCLEFVKDVVATGNYPKGYSLGDTTKQLIESSWRQGAKSLYGRFDLALNEGSIKLLEYNADTPTALLEASVAQWYWKEDRGLPDQFNSLHERLIEQWKVVGDSVSGIPPRIHFAAMKDAGREDWGTIEYLMDTALQAGIEVQAIAVEEIGWAESERMFVNLANEEILGLFKLYAWEWMMADADAPHYAQSSTRFIEPPWKMLLSHKGLLAELWKRHPGHPLLLPSYYEEGALPSSGTWARKPLLSREGANVSMVTNGKAAPAPGTEFNPAYDQGGYVLQEWVALPTFDGFHPVIGSWIVGEEPAGIGIREDTNPVTGNNSHFVPHYFR